MPFFWVLCKNITQLYLFFIVMMPNNREELIVDQDNGPTIKRDNKGKIIFAYVVDI